MTRMTKLLVVTLIFLLFGCTPENQTPSEDVETPMEEVRDKEENHDISTVSEEELDDVEITIISDNLNAPWSIVKINDTFYISERTGTIVEIKDGEQTRQEVEFTNDVSNAAEAGFMGFILTPDFEEFNTAYAYYTYTDNQGQFNRIVTLRLEDNQWIEESSLLDEIPSGTVHHGGRLKIGSDDKLYATVGDASNPNLAQDLEVLPGKILRMNLDGSIPENNPFEDSYIFSYGHRNPQGMTWLEDSTMYACEHGNRANDEVNLIEAGNNYGWPLIEGEQQQSDLIAPEFTSGQTTTWAPSGMATDESSLYVAGLRGNAVFVFDLETGAETTALTDFGRIRDIYIEEDYLYFITNNTDGRGNPEDADDRLYRIGLSEIE